MFQPTVYSIQFWVEMLWPTTVTSDSLAAGANPKCVFPAVTFAQQVECSLEVVGSWGRDVVAEQLVACGPDVLEKGSGNQVLVFGTRVSDQWFAFVSASKS